MNSVDMVRWASGGILVVLGVVCTLGNLVLVGRWLLFRRKASLVPLVGGAAFALGCAILPHAPGRLWWWLLAVIDPGTCLLAIGVCWKRIARRTTP